MTRVFFAEKNSKYNISKASAHGEITYLSEVRLSPFNTDQLIEHVLECLERVNFDPSNDIFAFSGAMDIICLTFATLCKRFPSVRILIFNFKTDSYQERIFDARSCQETI